MATTTNEEQQKNKEENPNIDTEQLNKTMLEFLTGLEQLIHETQNKILKEAGMPQCKSTITTQVNPVLGGAAVKPLRWTTFQGAKGPYEKTDSAENSEFDRLWRELEDHNGTLTKNAYFYWQFQDAVAIGRKPVKNIQKAY